MPRFLLWAVLPVGHFYSELGQYFCIVCPQGRWGVIKRGWCLAEFDRIGRKADIRIVAAGFAGFQHLASHDVRIVENIGHILDGACRDSAV